MLFSLPFMQFPKATVLQDCVGIGQLPLAYKSQGKLQRPLVAGWVEVAANLVTGSEQHDTTVTTGGHGGRGSSRVLQ